MTPKPFWTTKTVKGRQYIYMEWRSRIAGKVRSKSAYILPTALWERALKLSARRCAGLNGDPRSYMATILGVALNEASETMERRLLRAAFARLARARGLPVRKTIRRYTPAKPARPRLSWVEAMENAADLAEKRADLAKAELIRRLIPARHR